MRWGDISKPVVYHSTEWGVEIVADGCIEGRVLKVPKHVKHALAEDGMKGVCVTRSFRFAKMFAGMIFALDAQRLRQSFRFVPRAEGAYDPAHEHGDWRLEAEEFIPCEKIDLNRYLLGIFLTKELRGDEELKTLAQHPRFKGWFDTV